MITKPIIPVKKSEIVYSISELVDKTKKIIIVTMDLNDTDLPEKYQKSLLEAGGRGVKTTRYCFGTKRQYLKYVHGQTSGVSHVLAGEGGEFQRLLISDKKRMFFRVEKQFCYSESKFVISSFLTYLKKFKKIRYYKKA